MGKLESILKKSRKKKILLIHNPVTQNQPLLILAFFSNFFSMRVFISLTILKYVFKTFYMTKLTFLRDIERHYKNIS